MFVLVSGPPIRFHEIFWSYPRRLLYSIRYLRPPIPPPLNPTLTLIGTVPEHFSAPNVHSTSAVDPTRPLWKPHEPARPLWNPHIRLRELSMFIPRPLWKPHVRCGTHTNPHVHCGTHTTPKQPPCGLSCPALSHPVPSRPVPSTAAAPQPSRRARARTPDVHGHVHVHGDGHATPVTSLASFRPRRSAQQPTEAGDWRQM